MASPEQLIDKLDTEHDELVSINDLETNIGKLVVDKNTNELQELGLLLKQKDDKIESAFQITDNSNILQDLYVDLSKIEASELTPNQEKILQLCLYAGMDVLEAEEETLIFVGKAIHTFDPYVPIPTENLKRHGTNVRSYGGLTIHPITDPSIFGGLNQAKISDIFGHMTQIHASVKNDITDAEKEIIYTCNYKSQYLLDYALGSCSSFKKMLTNEIKNERNKVVADQLLAQIKDIEIQIKSLTSEKERLNKLLEEKISFKQLLMEVGLPQVKGLSLQKGMTITRRDGKMVDVGGGIKKTYFNYDIQNGDIHISLGYSEGIGYTVAGYFQYSFNSLFGGEHPLHEKIDEFYNNLGHQGDFRKDLREVNSLDETGLPESAKKLLTTPLNNGFLSFPADLSQENIYMIMYILTGKIKIKEDVQLVRIQDIKGLNLRYCKLTSLPPEIGNLVNLESLYLDNNQLTSLPPEIGNLVNLQGLGLSGNQLTSLPPEIGNLVNLQGLGLSGNQLTSIPPEIGNLVNLQNLVLSGNQLTSLPPEIGNLRNLQGLGLSGNQLTSLPPEIGNLVNLQNLGLSGNQLTSIPPEIGNLVNLQNLYLDNNQLTSIPPEIGNLVNLQNLDLDNNQLSSVPNEIGNLKKLKNFSLDNNQLTSLPDLNHLNASILDVRHNFLPYSEKLKVPDGTDFSPQIGEEENAGEGGDNGEGVGGDVSEMSEGQQGEYRDNMRWTGNPANDIVSAMPGVSDLSSFDYEIGNGMPGSKDKLNPVLIQSIESPLQDNYRGAIFDVQYDSKTNTSSKVKVEGKYQKAHIKNVDSENAEVHTMTLGRLEAGTHQIVLPLGARIVETEKGDYTMEQDKETGLYRVVVPEKTSVDGLTLQFVVEEETHGYDSKDYVLDQYKNILPNIGPHFDERGSVPEKVLGIKARMQSNSYYGFDTELDNQLVQYKSNPVEYCQKLYEEGTKRYEGKMMMVCNQSALFTALLLKKNGIPARVAVGIPGDNQVSGPGHAWTEYRDGEKRQKLDATPSAKPPQSVAQEMYDKQKMIQNQVQEKIKNDKKVAMEQIVGSFNDLPEAIKNKVNFQSIDELNFDNTPLTTEQLTAVIDMISLNRKSSYIRFLSLGGTGIIDLPPNMWKLKNLEFLDVGNTAMEPSNYNKLLSLSNLTSISAPESRHADPTMPYEIKNILLLQEIVIKEQKNQSISKN